MEFFIPGLFLFVIAIGLSFFLAPKLTPLVTAVLAIGFLSFGVYQHYKMFSAEYRLSTWQESLKIYAPAIMIAAIIIFIIYAILAFFTKGSVPVPSVPNITPPNANTVTDQVVDSLNKVTNFISNTTSNIVGPSNNKGNNNKNKENTEGAGENKNKNKGNNNLSRSFLETI